MKDKLAEAGKKIKLVVCDIDGTLVNSNREITKANREAIKKLREQNVLFSICTGRIATMAQYYSKTLQIDIPIITANGAVLWDPGLGKPAFDLPMDRGEVLEILKLCQFYGMDYSALTLGTSYFSKNSIRIGRFLEYNRIAKANGMMEMQLDYFDDQYACIRDEQIYKILIYDNSEQLIKVVKDYITKLKNTGCTSSEPGLLDISEIRVNKGFGLRKLTELLGLRKEQVCAVGDYSNDIPMLDASGFPVAMGNACQELKEQAVYVTKTNDESGVAWLLEQFILR